MGRFQREPPKRALSPSPSCPRKKLQQNVDRLRDLHQESTRLQAEISAGLIDAVTAAATLPPDTSSRPPHTVDSVPKPSRTLFDFNFSKSTLIPAADGTTKVVTINSAAAVEGTTISSLAASSSSLAPGQVRCAFASKGCKLVLGNKGAAATHQKVCFFNRVRQGVIAATDSSLSVIHNVPRIVVTDFEREARTSSDAVAQKVAALSEAKRASLKTRRDGKVDLRSLSTGGAAQRNKYSSLFKARVVRELDADIPILDVINKYSPDPFHPMQETMVLRYIWVCVCVCALCAYPTPSSPPPTMRVLTCKAFVLFPLTFNRWWKKDRAKIFEDEAVLLDARKRGIVLILG